MTQPLDFYLDRWHLTDPRLLTRTATSTIYTVEFQNETYILKSLNEPGARDEVGGPIALRCFDGRGAIRIFAHDAYAQLLEYAPGESLLDLVRRGDDAQATKIIIETLNQMHAPCLDAASLRSLESWFRSLFAKAAQDEKSGARSIYVRGAAVARRLLATSRAECALHGDIHHENIRLHPVRGWLAIDPKGLYGERTFDAANTLCNPVALPDLVRDADRLLRTLALLAHGLNIERDRLAAYTFAYACLSASWHLEDGGDPALPLWVATLVESQFGGFLTI